MLSLSHSNPSKNSKHQEKILIQPLKLLMFAIISLGLLFALGCDDSSSSDSGANAGTGTLSVHMTDAAANDFKAVYVTVDEVWVHKAENDQSENDADDTDNKDNGEIDNTGDEDDEYGPNGRDDFDMKNPDDGDGANQNQLEGNEWKIVASPHKTYNLLELVNGAMVELGTTELQSGHYTQVRLMLGQTTDDGANINDNPHPYPNYLVNADDTVNQLTIPSGYQTGIKLVHGFDITAGQTAELVLDFDANRSVVVTGSGKYLLKPTIKITDTLNHPLVMGVVSDEAGNSLSNVLVSAQKVDTDGHTEVFTSTRTAENDGDTGAYQMYLPTGKYYIVAYKGDVTDGQGERSAYGPSCSIVEADQLDAVYGGNNFNLGLAQTGGIPVDVTLPTAPEENTTFATLRVMQTASCSDSGNAIEVVSKTVGTDGTYHFSVPGSETGTEYTIVGSSEGIRLQETVIVNQDLTTPPIAFHFTQ